MNVHGGKNKILMRDYKHGYLFLILGFTEFKKKYLTRKVPYINNPVFSEINSNPQVGSDG